MFTCIGSAIGKSCEWTATLAIDTHTWLAELLDLPLGTPNAQVITALPASLGGLGFLDPQHEAALQFLQAVLPNVEELPAGEDDDASQAKEIAAAQAPPQDSASCATLDGGTPSARIL